MTDSSSPLSPSWAQRFGAGSTSPTDPIPAADLASQLAARLCHDFVSPASAIVVGLDLLEEPGSEDTREEAMTLVNASARKLVDLLAFSRVAFGSSASAESFDTRELERLTRSVFAHVRPELDWRVTEPSLSKVPARALLNLCQIAAGVLPAGGVATAGATVQAGEATVVVEAASPKARLRPEVERGLRGERLDGGLGGLWVQSYFLHQLVKSVGGRLDHASDEARVVLRAMMPA